MPESRSVSGVCIVGPGRLGLALADVLSAKASSDATFGRITLLGRRAAAPDHPVISSGRADYRPFGESLPEDVQLFLLTVPDGAIVPVAEDLAERRLPRVPVLHTSGVLSSAKLEPLRAKSHPVGSLHPLVAVPRDPGAGRRLQGAWFGVEGDPEAVEAAASIVGAVKGRVLHVDPSKKPLYHAAAVFTSNYVVTLLGIGEALMSEAGVEVEAARSALIELARGAVENAERTGPVAALTGPVSRGDEGTVGLHLAGLSPDRRRLYSAIAEATLTLATAQGLGPEAARRIRETLEAISE